jgi:hypothetical protein
MASGFISIELVAHPLVPEGEVWRIDPTYLSLEPHPRPTKDLCVYLHPLTLKRLKDRLWAQERVLASISYAELMIELQVMREEDGKQ